MFGSEILDVAIGLILVFLLLSFICSAIREGMEAWMKMRAVHLERGIRQLLRDPDGTGLTQALYKHPLIYGLYAGDYDPSKMKKGRMPFNSSLPAYIPAGNFARALLDIAVHGPDIDNASEGADPAGSRFSLDAIRASVGRLQNPFVQRALLSAVDAAEGDLARAQANVEAWYDSAMDRVSGWYKRQTQNILFAVGLIVTVAINANAITIVEALSQDDALRKAIVAEAEVVARDTTLQHADLRQRYAALEGLGLPLGWADGWPGPPRAEEEGLLSYVASNLWEVLLAPIFGWLITALAITLGAPFWFDVLNKFMVIRSTVKPHEKSPEEASEDRQRSQSTPQSTWDRQTRNGRGGRGRDRGLARAPAGRRN